MKQDGPHREDVLRNDLVPDGVNEIDVNALLDAFVTVTNLVFAATLGVGQGASSTLNTQPLSSWSI